MSWHRKGEPRSAGGGADSSGESRTPGKRTLTESLSVGRRAVVKETQEPDVGSVFERAMDGGSGEVPDRAEHERALGADFGGVSASFGRARELSPIGAEAAAYGDRVAFADAQPSRDVVAHELAHVMQFRHSGIGAGTPRAVSSPDDAAERAASRGDGSGGAPDAVHLARGKLKRAHKGLGVGTVVEIVESLPNQRVRIKWTDGDGDHEDEIDSGAIEEIKEEAKKEKEDSGSESEDESSWSTIPQEVAETLKTLRDAFEFMTYLRDHDDIAEKLEDFDDEVNEDLDRLRREVSAYADLNMDADEGSKWMRALMPEPIHGEKQLSKGLMKWSFAAASAHGAKIEIQFVPLESVKANAIGFVQTVVQQEGGKPSYDLRDVFRPGQVENEFEAFAEGETYVDPYDHASRSSPFYGADWSAKLAKWIGHDKASVGATGTAATMNDRPATAHPRLLDQPYVVMFESAAMVLETLEPLGVLRWGFRIGGRGAPLALLGATPESCVEAPSQQLYGALKQHYGAAKFVMCDGFALNGAEIPEKHRAELEKLAQNLRDSPSFTLVLGGAADLGEASAQELSLARAEAVKRFLVEKGAPETQLKIEAYGDKWARVPTDGTTPQPENRRVQIRPHDEDDLPEQYQTQRRPKIYRAERRKRTQIEPKASTSATPKPEKTYSRTATVTVKYKESGFAACRADDGPEAEAEAEVNDGDERTFQVRLPDGADEVRLTVSVGEFASTYEWKLSEPLSATGSYFDVTAKL